MIGDEGVVRPTLLAQWALQGNGTIDCGFIDYVRGVMWLYQRFGNEFSIKPVIPADFSLSRAFDWSNPELADTVVLPFMPEWVLRKYIGMQSGGEVRLMTNHLPDLTDVSRFKWLLTPKKEYDCPSDDLVRNTITGDYYCIHVRTYWSSDMSDLASDAQLNRYKQKVESVVNEYQDLPVVLVCDDDRLKTIPRVIHSPAKNMKHSLMTMTDEDIVYFFTDMKFISRAKAVTSVCDFTWNSTGFSEMPCAVHGVPYKNVRL